MPSNYVGIHHAGGPVDASPELWRAPLQPSEVGAPPGGHIFSAFVKDCSLRTPDGLLPGCRRLRDLFAGKELVGKTIKDCGAVPPYPDKRLPKRLPARREEYIHDSQTDLWYHCCEYRPRGGKFSVEVEGPRTKKPHSMVSGIASTLTFGLAGGGEATRANDEEPVGPRLQCNVLENMKHRQDDDGGRMISDKVSSSALGSLGSASGLSGMQCAGDQAVALQRFAGGTKRRVLFDETGHCVDTGPPGCATPMGKPYHVFRLAAPPPQLAGALFAVPAKGAAVPEAQCGQRRRPAGGAGGARDFL